MQPATMANGRASKRKHDKPANARSRAEFVKLIMGAWQEQVQSIIEVGIHLETAKLELDHGEYQAMIKDDLPFSFSTARILKMIAQHDLIRDHGHVMPANWRTLYELTKLTAEQFEAGIKSGVINPKMQRKDATALRGKSKPEKRHLHDSRFGDCLLEVREQITKVLPSIDTPGRAELFAALRQLITQIEENSND